MPNAARAITRRNILATGTLATGAWLTSACAGVQGGSADRTDVAKNFPTKTVEWTAPSSAGGSTDLISRAVAKAMKKPLGQPVSVVNKDGANGAVGGKEVLGREPDGYSLVMLFQSLLAIGPLIVDDPNAIQMSDMDVISGLTVEDYVLIVNADSPVRTLADLKKQQTLEYGTTGAGTGSQLAQALLFADMGVDATDVPFDGGAPTITAVLGNHVDVAAVQIAEAAPHVRSEKVRPVTVFAEERIEFLPDVPTAVEAGHDIVVDQRRWVAAPKGLPTEVQDTLVEAVEEAMRDPAYGDFLTDNYIGRWEVGPKQVVTQIEQATRTYADLLRKFDLKLGEA